MSPVVDALIDRCGSQLQAADMIGVSVRHVQKWCGGSSSPSKRSLLKIRMFLEGDNPRDRERRIRLYEQRAAEGRSVFQ